MRLWQREFIGYEFSKSVLYFCSNANSTGQRLGLKTDWMKWNQLFYAHAHAHSRFQQTGFALRSTGKADIAQIKQACSHTQTLHYELYRRFRRELNSSSHNIVSENDTDSTVLNAIFLSIKLFKSYSLEKFLHFTPHASTNVAAGGNCPASVFVVSVFSVWSPSYSCVFHRNGLFFVLCFVSLNLQSLSLKS
jgi:hypothetical protein